MVIDPVRLIDKYDFNSLIYGEAELNPILYRFVLPELYFKTSTTEVVSQMPDFNLSDPYELRNQRILVDFISRDSRGRKVKASA